MKVVISNSKYSITLPINPSDYTFVSGKGNTTTSIHSKGEVNLPGKSKLSTLNLSGILPESINESYSSDWESPQSIISKINNMMNADEAVKVMITDTNINMYFLIDQFSNGIYTGNNYKFELQLTEFKNINYSSNAGGLVHNGASITNNNTNRPPAIQQNNDLIVTMTSSYPNDCLWNIALYYWNNATRWPELQKLNNIGNVYTIPNGTKIRVPNPVRRS